MASDQKNVGIPIQVSQPTASICLRKPGRCKIQLWRKRQPTVRLGGRKARRGLGLVRLFRRVRLRWLKLQYSSMLKKVKEYYAVLRKEIMEPNSGSVEAFHQRLMLETSFAIPVMGMTFNSCPRKLHC